MSTIINTNSEGKKDTLTTNDGSREKHKKRKKHNKKSKKQTNRISLHKEGKIYQVESNDSFGPPTTEKKRSRLHNNANTSESVNETDKVTYRKFLVYKLRKKYDAKIYIYNVKKVNELIFNIPSHFTANFKEYLLKEEDSEFLKRFYHKNELKKKLNSIFSFYEKYSKIFPNYTVIREGHYMYKNILKKQKMIDKLQHLKEQEKQNKLNLLNLSNDTVFTNGAIDSIYNQKDSFYNANLFNIIELDLKNSEALDILRIQEIIQIIDNFENLNEIKKLESLAKKQIIYKKEFRDLRDLSKSVDTHKNKNKKKINTHKNSIQNIQNIDLNNNINENDSINEKERERGRERESKGKKKAQSDKKNKSKKKKLRFIETKQTNVDLYDIKENSFENEENNLAKLNVNSQKPNDKIILSPGHDSIKNGSYKKDEQKKMKKLKRKSINDNGEININTTVKKKKKLNDNNYVVTSVEYFNKNAKQLNENTQSFKKLQYPTISETDKKVSDSAYNIISKKERHEHRYSNAIHDRSSYSQSKDSNLTTLANNTQLYRKKVCNDTRGLSITKKNNQNQLSESSTLHTIDACSLKRISTANGGPTPNYRYNINTKISNLDVEENTNNDYVKQLKKIHRNQTDQFNFNKFNNASRKISNANAEFKNTGVYHKKRGLDEDKSCPKKNKYLSLIDKDALKSQKQKLKEIPNEACGESSSEESSEEEEEEEEYEDASSSYISRSIKNGVVVINKERNKLVNNDKKDNRNSITNKKENGEKKNYKTGTTKHKLQIDFG